MRPTLESQPWFLPSFLVVWVAAMAYVIAYLSMVVRYRRLTGLAQGEFDWITAFFDPATRQYFRWMLTDRHRAIGDADLSRHVYVVRGLFALAALLMASFVVALFARH
jgi:hypothetical protein